MGELLADAGEKITSAKAAEIEDAGVMFAYVQLETGREVKIASNGMVNIDNFVNS